MQPATASEIQPAISLLGKTPQLLETLLGDLPDDLLRWKPKPDRWSISEVLAHLAALEQVYTERVRRMEIGRASCRERGANAEATAAVSEESTSVAPRAQR